MFGDRRRDDYQWMRDRRSAQTESLISSENAHTNQALDHLGPLRDSLYREILERIQETDASVPAQRGQWWYLTRTIAGHEYAIHARRRGGPDGPETVILDENEAASGMAYFHLGDMAVSPDHRRLAVCIDTDGGERMQLRIRDLEGGDPDEIIEDAYYGLAWDRRSSMVFYIRPDAAMRPHQVWCHQLGHAAELDRLVFEERDERFFVSVRESRSGDLIIIDAQSPLTTESWTIPSGDPTQLPTVVEPRREGIEYRLDHSGSQLWIVTNDSAPTFRLVTAPLETPSRTHWTEVRPADPDVTLHDVDAFANHVVIWERAHGLVQLRILTISNGVDALVPQPEPVYAISPAPNLEFATTAFRFRYSSLITPPSTVECQLDAAASRTLLKTDTVGGGYDPETYVSTRIWATSADGTRVPVSVVRRRDVPVDGSAPCLVYGYGAYEISIEPAFSPTRISLLDRGVVFAIAHVRGGGEMGRRWHEQGRLACKPRTFEDFIAAADFLVDSGYADRNRLAIRGASAGGLLVGAVLNLRPDVCRAAVAEVPFVDVLNTMLDPTLPLTVQEWEEWGNPAEEPHYRVIRTYSPYDNVRSADYPAILATTGINDPRVSFWEPLKWVARLRDNTTSGRPILLRVDATSGHFGPSGRYEAWRDEAWTMAFILDQVGCS